MDSRKKHGLMLGFAAFGIFALSASAAFFLLPQVKIINELGDNPGDNPSSLTGKDLFLQNTLTSLGMTGGSEEPGLALDIETLNVDIPSKITTVDEDGQSVVTTYHNRISKAAGRDMSLRLALSELSLAGINLAAELPLDYNGELR